MSKQTINLIVFALTIAAGLASLALGHEQIGGAILLGALGHAVPSPFAKRETETTPSLERVEAEERGETP